jgi:hypothetical protein
VLTDNRKFTFYLGTDNPAWLKHADIPLFVSHYRIKRYVNMPRAICNWSLDSGGFTQLSMFGGWTITASEYANAVRRYKDEIGMMDWASQQDWMCEDAMLAKTGLSIEKHQELTVNNYLDLQMIAEDLPIVPVIQGQTLDQYRRHVDMFTKAGIDLFSKDVVGIGSVCRRQSTNEIKSIVQPLTLDGLKLHGFGMKRTGLRQVGHAMTSSDSMAWSFTARRGNIRLPECTHKAIKCSHCLTYALKWRKLVLQDYLDSFPTATV